MPARGAPSTTRVGQGQVGELLVVAVQLAVGCRQHQPPPGWPSSGPPRPRPRPRTIRCCGWRCRRPARATAARRTPPGPATAAVAVHEAVGPAGVHGVAVDRLPGAPRRPHGGDLLGRQDGVLQAGVDQRLQRARIGGGLGQPHALGLAPEAALEVGQAPLDLGAQIAGVQQRGDGVAPHLGHAAPRAQPPGLLLVPGAHPRQGGGVLPLDEAGQGGADVERQVGVVVDQLPHLCRRRRAGARSRWPGNTRPGCGRSSRGTGRRSARAEISSVQGFSRGGW